MGIGTFTGGKRIIRTRHEARELEPIDGFAPRPAGTVIKFAGSFGMPILDHHAHHRVDSPGEAHQAALLCTGT